MTEKTFKRLVHDEARRRAKADIDNAPDGWIAETRPAKRSLDQNAAFHSLCGDLEKQLPFAGKMRTLQQWKVLLVSAHSVATDEKADVVPGIEGEFVNLRESTAEMGVARMSSLIEYGVAYAVQNGVKLSA